MMTVKDAERILLRQAKRFHIASKQDLNPVVASRHNAYAVGIIDSLRDISENGIVDGVKVSDLRKEIIAEQDKLEGKAFEILEKLKKKGISIPGI